MPWKHAKSVFFLTAVVMLFSTVVLSLHIDFPPEDGALQACSDSFDFDDLAAVFEGGVHVSLAICSNMASSAISLPSAQGFISSVFRPPVS